MYFFWEEVRIVQAICHKKGVALLTRKNNPSEFSFNNLLTTRKCVLVALSTSKLLGQNTHNNIHQSFFLQQQKIHGKPKGTPPQCHHPPPKNNKALCFGTINRLTIAFPVASHEAHANPSHPTRRGHRLIGGPSGPSTPLGTEFWM